MFIILIGSVARKDFTIESDIDICRIGCCNTIDRNTEWPIGPINYIDYTIEEFNHLYDLGSLFIYHILYEGILLKGNPFLWERLKYNYVFKDNYSEQLYMIKKTCQSILDIDIFGNKFLSMFSNLFSLIKNYSIFYLAKNQRFIFNKKKAVLMVFGDFYFSLLEASYNYFERGIINDNWNFDSKTIALDIVAFYYSKMEEFENDNFSYST